MHIGCAYVLHSMFLTSFSSISGYFQSLILGWPAMLLNPSYIVGLCTCSQELFISWLRDTDSCKKVCLYVRLQDAVNCPFYLKTGSCRFGDRCSRRHPHLPSSTTLLIRAMYTPLGLTEAMLDERDHDVSLEVHVGCSSF